MELGKQIIRFVAARWENLGNPPEVAAKSLPAWYKNANRYNENEESTFRNCVPFFDAMTSGYIFHTPCDIWFEEVDGVITATVSDPNFKTFIGPREPLSEFHHPEGYYEHHFSFLPEWGIELEPGYSALYITPLNRFDLPFIVTSGIIDNDKMNTPGMIPFFVRKGFSGLLPKGTPYVQAIPFKRDNWVSIPIYGSEAEISRNLKRSVKFRSVKSDFYRDRLWQRKKFKSSNSVKSEDTKGDTDV